MMRSSFILFILLLVVDAAAQQPASNDGWLTVQSNPPGAEIYIDSTYIGKTPIQRQAVQSGRHLLKIFYPSAAAWNALSKTETTFVTSGNEVQLTIELGALLSINSDPAGARVFNQGVELGMTPLFYRSGLPLIGQLTLQKEGYESTSLPLNTAQVSTLVRLKPVSSNSLPRLPDILPPNVGNGNSTRLLTYVAGATMIVSGVVAAYFKEQGNQEFDKYLATSDPSSLSSTRTFDRESAIAITITQLSFAALVYLLLSE